ncbi:MAG: hypothetical protein K5769_03065 [Pseudobutyrivibrio sp.]|nr:hypothetical protein [Pseudobutyrivibrio sp.]
MGKHNKYDSDEVPLGLLYNKAKEGQSVSKTKVKNKAKSKSKNKKSDSFIIRKTPASIRNTLKIIKTGLLKKLDNTSPEMFDILNGLYDVYDLHDSSYEGADKRSFSEIISDERLFQRIQSQIYNADYSEDSDGIPILSGNLPDMFNEIDEDSFLDGNELNYLLEKKENLDFDYNDLIKKIVKIKSDIAKRTNNIKQMLNIVPEHEIFYEAFKNIQNTRDDICDFHYYLLCKRNDFNNAKSKKKMFRLYNDVMNYKLDLSDLNDNLNVKFDNFKEASLSNKQYAEVLCDIEEKRDEIARIDRIDLFKKIYQFEDATPRLDYVLADYNRRFNKLNDEKKAEYLISGNNLTLINRVQETMKDTNYNLSNQKKELLKELGRLVEKREEIIDSVSDINSKNIMKLMGEYQDLKEKSRMYEFIKSIQTKLGAQLVKKIEKLTKVKSNIERRMKQSNNSSYSSDCFEKKPKIKNPPPIGPRSYLHSYI